MKKILIVLALLLFTASLAYADLKERTWPFHALTGGGTGSLDGGISGVSPNVTDQFIGIDNSSGTSLYLFYRVTTDSAAENVPLVIRADDVGQVLHHTNRLTPSYLVIRKRLL